MKIWKEKIEGTTRYVWHGDGTVNGRRYRPRNLPTKAEVEAIFAVARARQVQRRYDLPQERPDVFLSELVAERTRDLDLSKPNHRRAKVVLEMFRNHFPHDPRVDALTAKDLLDYKRARLGRAKLAPNSINRELETVNAMLRHAGKYFPSLESWKSPPAPYEPLAQEGRQRVIETTEESRLLEALRAPRRPGRRATPGHGPRAAEQVLAHRTRLVVADLWELAPHVGMRRNEMRLMERSWVDFGAAIVHLPARATKKKRARDVPLNEVALGILRRRAAASPHPRFLFTNARGTAALSEYQMYRAIRKAAVAARVPYGRKVEGGFTLHDNRHTAVTRMLQSGEDVATVADVVGHSKKTMTLRYAHSTLESRRRAVGKLARFSQGLDKGLAEDSEHGGK